MTVLIATTGSKWCLVGECVGGNWWEAKRGRRAVALARQRYSTFSTSRNVYQPEIPAYEYTAVHEAHVFSCGWGVPEYEVHQSHSGFQLRSTRRRTDASRFLESRESDLSHPRSPYALLEKIYLATRTICHRPPQVPPLKPAPHSPPLRVDPRRRPPRTLISPASSAVSP